MTQSNENSGSFKVQINFFKILIQGIGGHIRPEERLMAAQQQQLVQAANAQHMAAMVALEAMQHQAKVC